MNGCIKLCIVYSADRLELTEDYAMMRSGECEFYVQLIHDLRAPLAAISGMARLLDGSATLPEPTARLFARRIDINAGGLLELVNSLLDYAELGMGEPTERKSAVMIEPLLHAAIEAHRYAAESKGLALELMIEAHLLPFRFVLDPLRVRRIVSNLVGNAVKFTKTGRVLIKASSREESGAAVLVVTVEDTGPGIKDVDRERIFRSFEVGSAGLRMFEGTGLGLSCARDLARAQGGDVSLLDSPDGLGSCFQFILPVTCDGSSLSIPEPGGAEQSRRLEGVRILLESDDCYLRHLLASSLRHHGALVFATGDGQDVLEAARSQSCAVIVVDLALSSDSLETAARLSEQGFAGRILAIDTRFIATREPTVQVSEADSTSWNEVHEFEFVVDAVASLLATPAM